MRRQQPIISSFSSYFMRIKIRAICRNLYFVVSELFLGLIFVPSTRVPPVPVSMTRNAHLFRFLEHAPAFCRSFCTMDLAIQRHRLKSYIGKNFTSFQVCWKPPKCPLTNIFMQWSSRYHWECMRTFSVRSHEKSRQIKAGDDEVCVQKSSSVRRKWRKWGGSDSDPSPKNGVSAYFHDRRRLAFVSRRRSQSERFL